MKNILNTLCGIGVATLCVISFTSAYTQEEISAYNWAYRNGITTQSTIDAANLNGKLTRQELSKMLTNYIENVAGVRQIYSSCSFTDEDKITPDLKPYTRKICSYKIMGTNGQDFRPTSKVNRAELGTAISRILWGDRYEVGGKDFYIYHLNALKDQGIMNDLENPTKSLARRGDTFIMLKRMSDKYGSNISMNGGTQVYSGSGSSYASTLYENSNVICEGQDGTKYYYDGKFLKGLRAAAEKKGETDLADYLKIEAEYFVDGFDQLESIDLDNLPELLGIDEDIDPDTMTVKEKQALLKKIKDGINKLIKENRLRNDKYLSSLKKITKNISDDKFGLKEKYEKTEEFIDVTNNFLDLYSEIIFNLMEMALTADESEIDDEEGMAIVFGLMGSALMYQSESEQYQSYVEDWARNTIKLLGGDANSSNIKFENSSSRASSNSQSRARDVARKNDLAQIQTAIITSQVDRGQWPGKNMGVTKGINVSAIKSELTYAGMSSIPSDPVGSSVVKGLGNYSASKGEYGYMVSTRNGVKEGGFVLMAKTEVEGGSNRVVCKNGQGLDKGYIEEGTDLRNIQTCKSITKGNTCSSNNYQCTYTDEDELRYILLY